MRDLEYQKGVLSEQLAIVSEQLWARSEQLATVSKQLMSVFKHLERKSELLRNVPEQKKGMVDRRIYFALLKSYCC